MTSMFDIDESEKPVVAPRLPAALRKQLVDDSNPKLPALLWSAVGREHWPGAKAFGSAPGFTTWRNPLDRELRFTLNLGPDMQLQTHFELSLIPKAHQVSREVAQKLMSRLAPLRKMFLRLSVVVAPGATVELPSAFDSAIRAVDGGRVISGKCHMLELVDVPKASH